MFILKQKHIKHSYNICNMPFVKKKVLPFPCCIFLSKGSISDDDEDRGNSKGTESGLCSSVVVQKKHSSHEMHTLIPSKTGRHCKTSEKAHGDRPPELFS